MEFSVCIFVNDTFHAVWKRGTVEEKTAVLWNHMVLYGLGICTKNIKVEVTFNPFTLAHFNGKRQLFDHQA